MDDLGIKTGRAGPVGGPSARESARESKLVHVAFETTMGAYYTFPDMMQHHFHELLQQLDVNSEQVIARNTSGVTLVMPLRIIQRVSLLEGDSYSMDHPTRPRHLRETSELWRAS